MPEAAPDVTLSAIGVQRAVATLATLEAVQVLTRLESHSPQVQLLRPTAGVQEILE